MNRMRQKLKWILPAALLLLAGCAKDSGFFGGRRAEKEAALPTWTPDGETARMVKIAGEATWLTVRGRYIRNQHGEPVLLRGVSIPDPQHADKLRGDRTASSMMRSAVKDLRANVIRIPVMPEGTESMGFAHDPQAYLKTHLDPVIDLAEKLGVYVIIDCHYIADYPELSAKVQEFWRHVAPRYKRSPNVIFEIFNEPIGPNDWTTFRAFAQPIVDRVRKMAPDNLIIVGGPNWSLNMGGAAKEPIAGRNIVYALHVYPRHAPATWQEDADALMQQHPVMVTEWGFESGAEPVLSGTRSGFGEPFVAWLEARQLGWTAWIYDDRWTSRMLDEGGALTGGEGGMGEVVAEALRRSWRL